MICTKCNYDYKDHPEIESGTCDQCGATGVCEFCLLTDPPNPNIHLCPDCSGLEPFTKREIDIILSDEDDEDEEG